MKSVLAEKRKVASVWLSYYTYWSYCLVCLLYKWCWHWLPAKRIGPRIDNSWGFMALQTIFFLIFSAFFSLYIFILSNVLIVHFSLHFILYLFALFYPILSWYIPVFLPYFLHHFFFPNYYIKFPPFSFCFFFLLCFFYFHLLLACWVHLMCTLGKMLGHLQKNCNDVFSCFVSLVSV